MADRPAIPAPVLSLEAPHTYVYSGAASTRGFRLNRFALSLTKPANRARFLGGEDAYLDDHGLSDAEKALVRARNWTGLLEAGGHLQAILKLAATLGQTIYAIGAHNVGADADALYAACPRAVSALPDTMRAVSALPEKR